MPDIPRPNGGQPVAPQGPLPDPVRQEVWRNVRFFAGSSHENGVPVRTVIVDTPFKQMIFPIPAEAAELLGKALIAPSVVLPGQG